MTVEVIEPHGLCAGVNAAIAKALRIRNAYCLHGLVHNEIVIDELKALGYRFVDRIEDVPVGETVVFSAHGVSPQARALAARRKLKVVDATCPFVAKVHRAAKSFSARGLPVVIIGDPRHVEAQGIAGECDRVRFWDCASDKRLALRKGVKVGVVSQTTMNADDVERRVADLKRTHDVETMTEVCTATKERQDAVRSFCRRHVASVRQTAVLVLGNRTSSNTNRLAEVARACGARAFVVGAADDLRTLDLGGVDVLGVTSGASTPERLFDEVLRRLRHVPRHVAFENVPCRAKPLRLLADWCAAHDVGYVTAQVDSPDVRVLESVGFVKRKLRVRVVGLPGDFPQDARAALARLEARTARFVRQMVIALGSGGRAELVAAVNAAVRRGEPVTEETFRRHLPVPDVPDPDMVVRMGRSRRGHDFLLWQAAHSERRTLDADWSSLTARALDAALLSRCSPGRLPWRKGMSA